MEETEKINISKTEIDMIYKYISLSFDEMSEDEKILWYEILKKYDPEFNDFDEQ